MVIFGQTTNPSWSGTRNTILKGSDVRNMPFLEEFIITRFMFSEHKNFQLVKSPFSRKKYLFIFQCTIQTSKLLFMIWYCNTYSFQIPAIHNKTSLFQLHSVKAEMLKACLYLLLIIRLNAFRYLGPFLCYVFKIFNLKVHMKFMRQLTDFVQSI